MMKKCYSIAFLLIVSLTISLFSPAASGEARADSANAGLIATPENDASEGSVYAEGEVIVSLAAPKRTALSKKGFVTFDNEIFIDNSWNFGDADILAETQEQKAFLEDKRLYVSHISSDVYSTKELMEKMSKQAYVVSAEPNYYRHFSSVTSDTYSDSQWYLDGTGTFHTDSKGVNYQKKNTSSQKTPVVAVVDSGIDYTHEDLAGHMWKNTFSSLEGVYGYDFGDNDEDPMDSDGHGTHCAGIIGAATDNGKGIAGICSDIRLMALKVDDSSGTMKDSSIVNAFNYIKQAQKLGVNIAAVNCSWGGGKTTTAIKTLIESIGKNGALFLFAADNGSCNTNTLSEAGKETPYDIDSDYVVTVGASDRTDHVAPFSDYGTAEVDIFAPGTQILSTIHTNTFLPALYPEEKRSSLVSFYSDGKEGSASVASSTTSAYSHSVTIEDNMQHSSSDFYGQSDNGSFYLPLTNRISRNTAFSAYLDVTGMTFPRRTTYYLSFEFAPDRSNNTAADSSDWEFYTTTVNSSDLIQKDGKTYLQIIALQGELGEYSGFLFDEIALTKADVNPDSFGKYAYMSGTSMATPVISGATAVLAGMFPSDSARQRRERLLSCVRKVAALSDKCKTGGIIDMGSFAASKVSPVSSSDDTDNNGGKNTNTKKVAVKKVVMNKKSAVLHLKKKLKLKAAVKPSNASNKKLKWSVSKSKYASVSQKGVVTAKKKGIGHTVKVYATSKSNKKKRAYCKVKIKKAL